MKEIATALAKAQAKMKMADTSSVNPHFKSKYADLAEVWEACRDALTSEGLSVVQLVQRGDAPYLKTILLHVSGESIESETPLFLSNAPTMQQLGAAVTYAKRISLMAIAGISVGEVDDDGEDNRKAIEAPAEEKRKMAESFKTMLADLKKLIKDKGLKDDLLAFAQRECQRLKMSGNAFLSDCLDNQDAFLDTYTIYLNAEKP